MKRVRLLSALLVTGLMLVSGSCSTEQSPTGVTAAATTADTAIAFDGAQKEILGGLLGALGLLKCTPMTAATATKTIGPNGGSIKVGPHTLLIPAGALDRNVTITAHAPRATVNSVEFTPAGLKFDRSAWLTMSYANCNLLGRLLPKRIAYTNRLLEILYYLLSIDNIFTKQVTGKVDHFSKYAVAW